MNHFCCAILLLFDLYQCVFSQTTEIFIQTEANLFIRCTSFSGIDPGTCSSPMSQATLFPGVTGTPMKTTLQNCGGNLFFYTLFDATPDQIFRLPDSLSGTPTPILDTTNGGFTDIRSFDLCCNRVFFTNGNEVYAQNIADSGLLITKRLVQATDTISFLEVSCNPDEYYVFHFIDGDGLYRTSMDGGLSTKIVDWNVSGNLADIDFHSENGVFAFGHSSIFLSVYDYKQAVEDGDTFPRRVSTIPLWGTRPTDSARAVSIASLAGSDPLTPIVYISWTSGTLTYADGSRTLTEVTTVSQNVADLFVCIDDADCSLGCSQCPCDNTDGFQDCCNGLCIPINSNTFSCFCQDESVFAKEVCISSTDPSIYPTDCPLDLIGAVKCQGSRRGETTFLYALSLFSQTSICATYVNGIDVSFPREAIPVAAASTNSFGYKFPGDDFRGNSFNGERYGTYIVRTSNGVEGMPGSTELVDSFTVVLQERNEAIYAKYITVTVEIGGATSVSVNVGRSCNTQRLRWMKDGKPLPRYKGKWAIPITDIQFSDEGIYEAYFRGRFKSSWRRIVRLIVSLSTCDATCITNGGVCSYSGNYCICPPGRTGILCENTCPRGTFGLIGGCSFDCGVEFGDECEDCQYILLCMEDPFGCQCYPGYELPNCSPCRRGFWGNNCQNECTCTTGGCDAYDGTCFT